MKNYSIFLFKPLESVVQNDLVKLLELEGDLENDRASKLLHKLPIDEMFELFARTFPELTRERNFFTLENDLIEIKLTYSDYHIKFEHIGLHLTNKPYREFELIAGNYECALYDPQSEFTMHNLPGSLIRSQQPTLLKNVVQIPIVPMPILADYIGLVDQDTYKITEITGILFEQQLDNLDYHDLASIETFNNKFVLRKYLRQQNPKVEILPVVTPSEIMSFEDVLKILHLSAAV